MCWVQNYPALKHHTAVSRELWVSDYPGFVSAGLGRWNHGTLRATKLTMLSILTAVFQFALNASDPSWSCELTHRDPGIAGTYYLYCAQMSPDGVELITVGRFISDAHTDKATQ